MTKGIFLIFKEYIFTLLSNTRFFSALWTVDSIVNWCGFLRGHQRRGRANQVGILGRSWCGGNCAEMRICWMQSNRTEWWISLSLSVSYNSGNAFWSEKHSMWEYICRCVCLNLVLFDEREHRDWWAHRLFRWPVTTTLRKPSVFVNLD